MKRYPCLFVAAIVLGAGFPSLASAQTETQHVAPSASQKAELTNFDLDFAGGTPQELVSSIQKAMGRPLNVIIPPSFSDVRMPPLVMRHVTVLQLFRALTSASPLLTPRYPANPTSDYIRTSYAFKTDGEPSDDSVWYFTADLPSQSTLMRRSARFFNLMPYLAQGLTVDDITTAIQTGWKMGGDSEGCELSYHKETNLLIVVGDASQFETVNGVLVALTQQTNAVLSAYLDDKKAKALAAPPTSARTETKKADK